MLKIKGRVPTRQAAAHHHPYTHHLTAEPYTAQRRMELNPDEITYYALRHSSIVRALLGGVPVAVVAQQHDTCVREIEAHYAAYILDHSDSLSRRALLNTAVPRMADNVVTAFRQ